jgi:hypothetical protein
MYVLYIPVLGFGVLRRSTACLHAGVRAVLPCSHEKITIFGSALKYFCWEKNHE